MAKGKQAQQRTANRQTGNRKAEQNREPDRVPLGQYRRKMTLDPKLKQQLERDGYVLRWINDDNRSRIDEAQAAGYTFVTTQGIERIGDDGDQNTDPGSRISMRVGTCDDGSAMRAYLMAIPRQYYEKDQSEKQKQIDAIDQAIKNGQAAPGEKQYVPEGGIRYQP